jgi:hypothetical protein
MVCSTTCKVGSDVSGDGVCSTTCFFLGIIYHIL